jgi:hypothetical protein
LGHGSDLQSEIEAHDLVDLEIDVAADDGLESAFIDRDAIGAGAQQGHGVKSDFIGRDFPMHAGIGIGHRHSGSWHVAAGRICNLASDLGGLAVRRYFQTAEKQKRNEVSHDCRWYSFIQILTYVRRTHLIEINGRDFALPDFRLVAELELLQHTGSFKARGAFSNLLTRAVPPAGVVAASGASAVTAPAW